MESFRALRERSSRVLSVRSRTARRPPRAVRPDSRGRPRRRRRRAAHPGAGRRRTGAARCPHGACAACEREVPAARTGTSPAGEPSLEGPDPVDGPVGGEGSPDDPSGGHGSPEPAVVGFATIVAHHEPVTGGNLDRLAGSCTRERSAPRTGGYRSSDSAHAVDDRVAFDDRERLAGSRDYALDEVDARTPSGRGRRRLRRRGGPCAAPGRRAPARRLPAGGRPRSRRHGVRRAPSRCG